MHPHPLDPGQRVRRWRYFLLAWRLHRWLGLGVGAVIVALSLTGGLLVMHHDVERWLHPEWHAVHPPEDPSHRAPLVPVLRELQARAPAGFRPLRLEPGREATDSDKVIFVGPDRSTRWSAFINPYTGAILWHGSDQSLFTPWLLHLHMHFHAGRWGYVAAGLGGVALTLLGGSGIWITRGRLRVLLRPCRLRLGGRVALADLHRWVGIATSYFTLVLGGTGIWFSVLLVPREFVRETPAPLAPPFELARLAPIEPALDAARACFPGAELSRVTFPREAGAPLQVRLLHRDAPVWRKQSGVDFDPATGRRLKVRDGRDAPFKEQLNSILAPLHFGFYGATWVKWLYVAGGFAPTVLALSGTGIWWLRTRRRPSRP